MLYILGSTVFVTLLFIDVDFISSVVPSWNTTVYPIGRFAVLILLYTVALIIIWKYWVKTNKTYK